MPLTIVGHPISVKRLFRQCSCAHATMGRSSTGIHRWIGDLDCARVDLSGLCEPPTTDTRARRGGSPTVDDGG
jgi:hypothetical protein